MPRPKFRPTPEQRKLVQSLAALGMRQDRMCVVLRLKSPKTLRKHFRQELASGFAEALATITHTAYQMATSGSCPAMTMFWLKSQAKWLDPEQQATRPPVQFIWKDFLDEESSQQRPACEEATPSDDKE